MSCTHKHSRPKTSPCARILKICQHLHFLSLEARLHNYFFVMTFKWQFLKFSCSDRGQKFLCEYIFRHCDTLRMLSENDTGINFVFSAQAEHPCGSKDHIFLVIVVVVFVLRKLGFSKQFSDLGLAKQLPKLGFARQTSTD